MNFADKESIVVMKKEIRRLEDYIRNCPNTLTDDYAESVDRAIELRKRLGIKERR